MTEEPCYLDYRWPDVQGWERILKERQSHREIDYPPPETVAERRRKLQRAKLRIVGGRS